MAACKLTTWLMMAIFVTHSFSAVFADDTTADSGTGGTGDTATSNLPGPITDGPPLAGTLQCYGCSDASCNDTANRDVWKKLDTCLTCETRFRGAPNVDFKTQDDVLKILPLNSTFRGCGTKAMNTSGPYEFDGSGKAGGIYVMRCNSTLCNAGAISRVTNGVMLSLVVAALGCLSVSHGG